MRENINKNYIMNIENFTKDIFVDIPPYFSEQASPYLSPFRCVDSNQPSHSEEGYNFSGLNKNQEIPEMSFSPEEDFSNSEEQAIDYRHQIVNNDGKGSSELKISRKSQRNEKCEKIQKNQELNEEEKIRFLINILIEFDTLNAKQLAKMGRNYYGQCRDLQFIFQVLMPKFSKLRKTKEQMTKYCMRKAFKFIGELKFKNRKTSNKNSKKDDSGVIALESMPFKKNSQDKTMNTNFLKKIFSNKEFVAGYQKFITQFRKLMIEDNQSKVDFLAQMIIRHIKSKNLEKIENIKRLPWTKSILEKTEELGKKFLQYSEQFIETQYQQMKL